MTDSSSSDQLTVHEAAKLTGYSRETIYRAVQNEKIKHTKRRIGRLIFYLIDRVSLLEYRERFGRGAADGRPAR